MIDPTKLKVGDKFYSVEYCYGRMTSGREVIKINTKSLIVKYIIVEGFGNMVGSTDRITMDNKHHYWKSEYLTLKEAYQNVIDSNTKYVAQLKDHLKELPQQIKDTEDEVEKLIMARDACQC